MSKLEAPGYETGVRRLLRTLSGKQETTNATVAKSAGHHCSMLHRYQRSPFQDPRPTPDAAGRY